MVNYTILRVASCQQQLKSANQADFSCLFALGFRAFVFGEIFFSFSYVAWANFEKIKVKLIIIF